MRLALRRSAVAYNYAYVHQCAGKKSEEDKERFIKYDYRISNID